MRVRQKPKTLKNKTLSEVPSLIRRPRGGFVPRLSQLLMAGIIANEGVVCQIGWGCRGVEWVGLTG